jgi:tetratricopeptide (TPR) repeat protein
MKKWLLMSFVLAATYANAQRPLTTPPSGGNKKAMVGERIGITDVTIHYDRPAVKGREGKIWGQLVPTGFTDQGFGSSKAAPWRAGANESTTIEFSTDVKIEGQSLAAGKYGFFIAYDPTESTLIFSKDITSWGSFYYDPSKDVLRLKVKPVTTDRSVEWLRYEFNNQSENSATASLVWEKQAIPFKIEVDLNKTQVESFRRELRTDKGFFWLGWQTAAQWCVDHNTNLEEALAWADTATNPNILGDRNFSSLSTKAQVLAKLGRTTEAETIMKEAVPLGNMNQIHQYGRQLLTNKNAKGALEVFKTNFEKNPNQFTTLVGMTRGYSGVGDYKKALEYAEKALPLAPNALNKTNVEKMIGQLKEGKDIN